MMSKADNNSKKLIIHGGLGKTGTTALQEYLSKNYSKFLKNHRILYPKSGREVGQTAHLDLALSLRGLSSSDSSLIIEKLYIELKNKSDQYDTVVISSEEFSFIYESFMFSLISLVKTLQNFELFNSIELVFYIRRQDEYIESTFKQVFKNSKKIVASDINSIYTCHKKFLKYSESLTKLKANLPKDVNIKLFIYQKNIDIINHFLKNVLSIKIKRSKKHLVNPSFSPETALALNNFNENFDIPNEEYEKIVEYAYLIDQQRGSTMNYLLSLEQRINILDYYKLSNEKLFKEWFETKNQWILTEEEIQYYKSNDEYVKADWNIIQNEIDYRLKLLKEYGKKLMQIEELPSNLYLISEIGYYGIFGWIDRIDENLVSGWIFNSNLDKPSTVILIVDGNVVAEKEADLCRKDVTEQFELIETFPTGFTFKWDVILPQNKEFLNYLKSHSPEKELDIKIIEKASQKGIRGNYVKLKAADLLKVLDSIYGHVGKVLEENNRVRLNGWLFNLSKPIKRIYIENNNGEVIYGFPREDVYKVYPVENAKSSGFSLFINGNLNSLSEFINVKVVYEDRSVDIIKVPTQARNIQRLKKIGEAVKINKIALNKIINDINKRIIKKYPQPIIKHALPDIVNELFTLINNKLQKGEDILIPKFGIFKCIESKKEGKEITKNIIRFITS